MKEKMISNINRAYKSPEVIYAISLYWLVLKVKPRMAMCIYNISQW